ncbi:transglutaminase-like domain-containing protein [Paenibacillus thalictri]|uniref:Transglutaminase family protein n=1 Tax=Paenibacillus thalictri TaxID=2527873 RepID=A0A4Q9DPT8_9BACL|nr:transglutaminase family protein [Paenibacillus thalictri]TBL75976.1 transglutaminase family protein [Paenibacillus thalictri]
MVFSIESDNLKDFLPETEELDFSHPAVRDKAAELATHAQTEIDFVQAAYEFVRDQINHSWDIQSRRVTRKASEVLTYAEGICYAKSNLLAALLRANGVPTGFCYQRLTLGDEPETGYCIHALNAVYLESHQRWVRLDARGNKEGVDAQFSLEREQLAFPVRTELGEVDYPTIFARPHPKTMNVLANNEDCLQMYAHGLPTEI